MVMSYCRYHNEPKTSYGDMENFSRTHGNPLELSRDPKVSFMVQWNFRTANVLS